MPERMQLSSRQSMTIWGSMEAFLMLPTWIQTLGIGLLVSCKWSWIIGNISMKVVIKLQFTFYKKTYFIKVMIVVMVETLIAKKNLA
jgi:hypothetical protein